MKKLIYILLVLIPGAISARDKNMEIHGKYIGKLPHRWDYITHKPTFQLNRPVSLTLRKNHKCVFESDLGKNYGKWTLSGDTLTCVFTKEKDRFVYRKIKPRSAETYTYRVTDKQCLYPLDSKILFCKRRKL